MPRQTTGAGGSEGPLSPLIHGRVRLLVLSHLLTEDRPLPFTQLRDHLGLTDGTLSVHLQKLEAGGIVELEKRFGINRDEAPEERREGQATLFGFMSERPREHQ